jgi:flagellar hook protein FlgE
MIWRFEIARQEMFSVLNSALAGLHRHERGMHAVANNIANMNTEGFHAQRYDAGTDSTRDRYEPAAPAQDVEPASDVDLAHEFVDMKLYELGYRANLAVIVFADRTTGALLDIFSN